MGWEGSTHLVKEAILADELLPGLGVDGDGEPHMCHKELAGEQKYQRRLSRAPGQACTPLEPPGALGIPIQSTMKGGRRTWEGSAVGTLAFTTEEQWLPDVAVMLSDGDNDEGDAQ